MVHSHLKKLFLPVLCVSLVAFVKAGYDESNDWDNQDPELTKEIEGLTTRPQPYLKTPPGYFPFTEISPPDHFYEAEYKDKPCQDKAKWSIRAGAANKVFDAKSQPKVIVDKIKVSKVNGEYKVEQEIVPKDLGEVAKPAPIEDTFKDDFDAEEKPKEIVAEKNNDDEQINLKDIKEGKKVPIGDNVVNDAVENNVPIGDNLKANEDAKKPNEEPKDVNDDKPRVIGDNVQFHVDGIEANNVNNEEQLNMKDAMKALKEEPLSDDKKETDQKLYAMINAMNPAMNMRNLYNIAEETGQNEQQNINVENVARGCKIDKKVEAPKQKEQVEEEKSKIGCKKPVNDIQIKIKLETLENPKDKSNNNMNSLNSLFDLGRKSLGGFDQFQSMLNRIMPLAQNVFNSQNSLDGKPKPQNFYMKYLQIDPSADGLKYQYYYFQKYVNSRYNSAKSQESAKSSQDSKPSLLMSKLLSQMLGSMSMLSPLTFLSPLTLSNSQKLPMKIYMNERSAAKYAANLDRIDGVAKAGRAKREAGSTTTEMPLFNEGPFKVKDPAHIKWARDFIKEFPKDKVPTKFHIIHQQPVSQDILQWYHPFPGEPATYYTIEPTVTRVTAKGEPVDLCECCHHGTRPEFPTPEENLLFKVGDKDPFYPDESND